jgi:hypothetical protein
MKREPRSLLIVNIHEFTDSRVLNLSKSFLSFLLLFHFDVPDLLAHFHFLIKVLHLLLQLFLETLLVLIDIFPRLFSNFAEGFLLVDGISVQQDSLVLLI